MANPEDIQSSYRSGSPFPTRRADLKDAYLNAAVKKRESDENAPQHTDLTNVNNASEQELPKTTDSDQGDNSNA